MKPTFLLGLHDKNHRQIDAAEAIQDAHKSLVKTAETWQLTVDDSWIIGLSFTNISAE